VNLRTDPFEEADISGTVFYWKWRADHLFMLVPAQALVGMFIKTFEEFPPRQRPSSFSLGDAIEKAREKEKSLAAASDGGVK
jgi:hypothetical protein